MYKLLLTKIFCLTLFTSSSQEFVFAEESFQASAYYHSNQVWLVELSLRENRVPLHIRLDDGYDFKTDLSQLSSKLQQIVPTEYWKAKSRPHLIDTLNRISSDEHCVRWTFGKIEQDKRVSYYGQLIVYFSDSSPAATVIRVNVKKVPELTTPDSKKVVELYEQFKAYLVKNPLPPPPPLPIRGN